MAHATRALGVMWLNLIQAIVDASCERGEHVEPASLSQPLLLLLPPDPTDCPASACKISDICLVAAFYPGMAEWLLDGVR